MLVGQNRFTTKKIEANSDS